MTLKTKIGTRIKELRTQQVLTQEELAWKSNIDRTFMNHVENAKSNISIETLEKIVCDGLEVSFRSFFNSEIFEKKK